MSQLRHIVYIFTTIVITKSSREITKIDIYAFQEIFDVERCLQKAYKIAYFELLGLHN